MIVYVQVLRIYTAYSSKICDALYRRNRRRAKKEMTTKNKPRSGERHEINIHQETSKHYTFTSPPVSLSTSVAMWLYGGDDNGWGGGWM